jgi:hypothetical protein
MAIFQSFQGIISMIDNSWTGYGGRSGCYKLITVTGQNQSIVNFIVSPNTYFVDQVMVSIGDSVVGFYDANAPTPLIYPPQFPAIVMAMVTSNYFVKVDYFNSQLESSDGSLQLNIAPTTQMLLENGQRFTGNPANRNLIVIYGITTRSIPAQTTPYQIIVMC